LGIGVLVDGDVVLNARAVAILEMTATRHLSYPS
jgi:hypothetical protein